VIAVGQRVFINCPDSRSGTVTLVDETGKLLSATHLVDGTEVEVVAWRPRGGGDASYRVRTLADGTDGWLPGENLRKERVPLPPAEPSAPPAPVADPEVRRFGQRSLSQPLPSASPAPAEAAPVVDTGERRFGRRN
jgi:hypothetical protein